MSGGQNFFLTKGFVLENPQINSSPPFGRWCFDQISSKMSACGAPKISSKPSNFPSKSTRQPDTEKKLYPMPNLSPIGIRFAAPKMIQEFVTSNKTHDAVHPACLLFPNVSSRYRQHDIGFVSAITFCETPVSLLILRFSILFVSGVEF